MTSAHTPTEDVTGVTERRFGGLRRLYGEARYERLRRLRVAVVGLGVKGFLLLGRQRRVEGLGGLATAVGLGGVLGAHGPHAVDALGGGQFVHVLAVQTGRAFARLHGRSERCPRGFLRGGQLELALEGGQAFGMVFGTFFCTVAMVAFVPFSGLVARGGFGCGGASSGWGGWGWLGQNRQGQRGQNSGGGKAVLEAESHGVGPFTGVARWNDRSGD